MNWYVLSLWHCLHCLHSTHAGELLLLQVHRHQNQTPLLEPATETAYGGRRLVAVATHRGAGSRAEGGHWRCHIRQGSTWWLLDSLPSGRERPEQSNPFLQQHKYKICMMAFKWNIACPICKGRVILKKTANFYLLIFLIFFLDYD